MLHFNNNDDQMLVSYLLKRFATSGALYKWLQDVVWPEFKARHGRPTLGNAHNDAVRAAALERRLDREGRQTRFAMPDSDTPLSFHDVERAARKGIPLLEISTGRLLRWRMIDRKIGYSKWTDVE